MRKCACDWNTEIDAQVAINRLDDAGADMTPAEIARRFSEMGDWIKGMIDFDMELVRYYREHHGINVLLRSQWIQQGGGLATKQAYYDGIYQIADDEALIVEFPVPADCHYWQILVADDRFATVDWVNRQSSLNDVQARVDPRRLVPRRRVATGSRRAQLARQGRLAVGHPASPLLSGRPSIPRPRVTKVPVPRCSSTFRQPRRCDSGGAAGAAAAPTDRGPVAPHLVTHPHYLLTHLG